MVLKECMLIKNKYFCNPEMTDSKPTGIVVHSTGCNNPWLKRYVQPVEEQSYYDEVIADVGKNYNGNSWNRPEANALVHAMIGKNKNSEIETYQILPWTTCCAGVWRGRLLYAGAPCYEDTSWKKVLCYTDKDIMLSGNALYLMGKQGYCAITYNDQSVYVRSDNLASYNLNPTARIQFEIQEDSLENEDYFKAVFKEAVELCAYLCKKYNLTTDLVCSHNEAYKAGYGTQHADPDHWLKKFDKDMDWFRAEVQKLLDAEEPEEPEEPEVPDFKQGDVVFIKDGVTTWVNGRTIASWVFDTTLYVYSYDKETHKVRVTADKTLQSVSGTLYDYQIELDETQQPYEAPEQPEDEHKETATEDIKANPEPSEEPCDEPDEQQVPADVYPDPIPEPDETENDYPRDDEPEDDFDVIVEPTPEPLIEPDDEPVKVTTWWQIIIEAIKWLFNKIFKKD